MNCFMSYNPNVAKEVKITTWIKEFDGASPVYPSFPNEGDCFIVFDTDEAKEPSVNKTYTSGEWADTSSGGGGGGDFNTAEVTIVNNNNNDVIIKAPMIADYEGEKYSFGGDYVSSGETRKITVVIYGEASLTISGYGSTYTTTGNVEYNSTYNEFIATGDGTITFDA